MTASSLLDGLLREIGDNILVSFQRPSSCIHSRDAQMGVKLGYKQPTSTVNYSLQTKHMALKLTGDLNLACVHKPVSQ